MIQVVMFDLGMTLIDANHRPYPHATDALAAVAARNVKSCLVSDFDMSLTPAKAMRQYTGILQAAGLRAFFEPVNKRVTLSNHAGAEKPSAKVFRKALQRLGVPSVPLTDCLLVTENAAHVAAARSTHGMRALRFGVDFTDWAQFPALVSQGPVKVPITVPGHEDMGTILVEVPEAIPEHIEEARSYAASLAAHGRIAGRAGKKATQPTHAIETDQAGDRGLVRKRFSLIKK